MHQQLVKNIWKLPAPLLHKHRCYCHLQCLNLLLLVLCIQCIAKSLGWRHTRSSSRYCTSVGRGFFKKAHIAVRGNKIKQDKIILDALADLIYMFGQLWKNLLKIFTNFNYFESNLCFVVWTFDTFFLQLCWLSTIFALCGRQCCCLCLRFSKSATDSHCGFTYTT